MMAFEMKPNSGSLFRNDKKDQDTHPDYKGSALIDGLGECWLDAWVNTSNNGTKYMSLKIKPKEAYQTGNGGGMGSRPQPAGFDDGLDDPDVPFLSADPRMEGRVG